MFSFPLDKQSANRDGNTQKTKCRALISSCGYLQLSQHVGTGKGVTQINNFRARQLYLRWACAACAPACRFSVPANNFPRHCRHRQSFGRCGDRRGTATSCLQPRFQLNPIFEGFRAREGSYGSPEGRRLLRDGTRLPPNAWPNVAQDPGKIYPRALQLNRPLTRLATGERSTL